MIADDLQISLTAPARDAEDAIVSSRRRISWSATQIVASNETSARAQEALKQSYIRLRKVRPRPASTEA